MNERKRIQFKRKSENYLIDEANRSLNILSPASMLMMSALKSYNLYKNIDSAKNLFKEQFGFVSNKKDEKYAICLGYAVKKHTKVNFIENKNWFGFGKVVKKTMAVVHDGRDSNILEPLLVSDKDLREHIQIIGTTGSGKTEEILGITKQQIARGGGAVVVFGKGDNDMVQKIYGTALEYNRQNDFFLFDFINANAENLKTENYKITNNSLNLFDVGDMLSIINLLKDIAGITNKGNSWEQGSSGFLESVIRVLYILEKCDLLFDIEEVDEILKAEDTLEAIRENKEQMNGYMLSKYLIDIRLCLKLSAIISKLYKEEGNSINDIFHKIKNENRDVYFEKTIKLKNRDRLDSSLKDTIVSSISTKINYDNMIEKIINSQDEGIDEVIKEADSNQGAFYKLGISSSRLKVINDFLERYELILKNRSSDIDIIEAIKSGKIIVFNIPGQEPQEAQQISKLIIGILKLIVKKESRSKKDIYTFLIILDEINSWAKGKKDETLGIGDLLSVIRGLGMGAIVAHQSDLNSMDSGAGIEKSQVEGNVGMTIVLKNKDSAITKKINEDFKKRFEYYEKEIVRINNSEKENLNIDYEMREEDALPHELLSSLNTGQAYILKKGAYEKMIAFYSDGLKYSKHSEEIIPINKTIDESDLRNFVKAMN